MIREGIKVWATGRAGGEWVEAQEGEQSVYVSALGARLTPEEAHRLARRIHWLARRVEKRLEAEWAEAERP